MLVIVVRSGEITTSIADGDWHLFVNWSEMSRW